MTDISGMGAYREGGRWNNQGTYMLYTSENSSLAYLENLVHFESENTPPNLYLMSIEIKGGAELIYTLPEKSYPKNWLEIGSLENKAIGDELMERKKYLAVRVKSAINPFENNLLLNPLFAGYHDLIRINSVELLDVDARLVK